MTIKVTEFIVTKDLSQNSTTNTQKEGANRRKIEQLHREAKQNTGLEKCQCRTNRSQRNHIACAFLVWQPLIETTKKLKTSIYQVKPKLLQNYENPTICVFGLLEKSYLKEPTKN